MYTSRLIASGWRHCTAKPFSTSASLLSGHNKWSKIKQRKGAADAQKSVLYGKVYKDILVAVRNGGSADPEINTTLAGVMKKARSQGVPKDNVESALSKAARGREKGDQYVVYEAMAHGSIGVMIECQTDNVNRTLHGVREILTSHGARFANVGYLFERKGYVKVALDKTEGCESRVEQVIEAALEASAEDFEEIATDDDSLEVEFTCPPAELAALTTAVSGTGLCRELLASELIYAPIEDAGSQREDEDTEAKIADLVDALENNQDTLRVWTALDA